MTQKPSLILSTAMNYDRRALEPFVASWKQNVPKSDLVLFCKNLSPETVTWLLDSGVDVLPADLPCESDGIGWRKGLLHYALVASARLHCTALSLMGAYGKERIPRTLRALYHLYGYRYTLFLQYLTLHGSRYECVLLADCRDVVFQHSPFPCEGLHAFGETERIGESHFAKRWFQLSYGTQAWRDLAHLPFLCAGVTLGTSEAVLRYVQTMDSECQRVMAFTSEDQAVHNYVIHNKLVPANVHDIGEGVAINLNAASAESLKVIDGELVDPNGIPYAVVHQYDRVPGLSERLSACKISLS